MSFSSNLIRCFDKLINTSGSCRNEIIESYERSFVLKHHKTLACDLASTLMSTVTHVAALFGTRVRNIFRPSLLSVPISFVPPSKPALKSQPTTKVGANEPLRDSFTHESPPTANSWRSLVLNEESLG